MTLYKMLSSYLTIVPKEEIPIDMEKLNEAILGERGYYDMLLKTEKERKSVLRCVALRVRTKRDLKF